MSEACHPYAGVTARADCGRGSIRPTGEYQAVTEELQPSNEELETTKEDLQSVNEELQTINGELQTKIDAIMRLNSDLKNYSILCQKHQL